MRRGSTRPSSARSLSGQSRRGSRRGTRFEPNSSLALWGHRDLFRPRESITVYDAAGVCGCQGAAGFHDAGASRAMAGAWQSTRVGPLMDLVMHGEVPNCAARAMLDQRVAEAIARERRIRG